MVGEPGIGKTTPDPGADRPRTAAGATIPRGGCYEYEATTPYLPFVEGLRAHVHAYDADTLRAQLGPTAAELARLAPEIEVKLGVLAPSPSLPPGDERLRLFDNIARFLRSWPASVGCCSSSTICTGPTAARWCCCTIRCAICAATACWWSSPTARSNSTQTTP